MSDATTLEMEQTAGIDLGDRDSHYEIIGADGDTVAKGRFRTTPRGLEKTFGSYEPMRIAFETGTHAHGVKDVLERLGHEVIVANARKVELIWKNDRKSDERDPAFLARLARVDPKLLAPVKLRDGEAQDDLTLIRARENMVAARTQLINAAGGLVKARGGRLPCTVNLLPWNPVEEIAAREGLRRPGAARVEAFADALRRGGLNVTVRRQRGADRSAACGQLRLQHGS